MKHLPCLLPGLLLVLAALPAQAQKNMADDEFDHATGTRVQVRSVFDPLPPTGYAPMRVTGTNGTGRDARWRFSFSSGTNHYRQQNKHGSSFTLDMPAHATQSALFLVPLAAPYGTHGYGSDSHALSVDIDDTGFDPKHHSDHDNRIHGFPALAISPALAEFSITALNKEMESRLRGAGGYFGGRADLFGSQFEPDNLPDSWLGFSGFDYMLMSGTEWVKLKPQVRRALLEWVRFGGRLDLYLSAGTNASSLGLPEGFVDKMPLSLGKIRTFEWDGKSLPAPTTVARYWGTEKRVESLVQGYADRSNWPLLDLLGSRHFASWQVMVFLVVFGILVGPVNLFVLAPAGKRHKLFVTTPLLSVGASVVMVVLILVQDGTGGIGRRFVAVNLEPGEAAAYVTQEQISRTGVLLSTGFQLKQPALVEPVALPNSPWAKLKNDQFSQAVDLTQEGRDRRGSYFQSRAEQGQTMRAVIPTRARVELKAGAVAGEAPALISALGFTVEELIYVDAAGDSWKLKEPLGTGQSATLVKTDAPVKDLWKKADFAPAQKDLLRQLENTTSDRRSFFIAKTSKAADFTLDTLPAIRWQEDQIVVFGPVAQP